MKNTNSFYEKIEAYLSNQMEANERLAFEEKMGDDRDLKMEVESFRMAQAVIISAGRKKIQSSVDDAFEKSQQAPRQVGKVLIIRRLISMAAAVLLLAVVGYWFWSQNKTASPTELFATHFELPIAPNVRNGATEVLENWNQAIKDFNQKDFQKYVDNITPLLTNENFEYRNEGYLFLGLSQLEMQKNEAALTAFEKISRTSSYGQDADWYTALTYLKTNQIEEAKTIFQKIKNSNSAKRKQAEEILKQLD